ncbi:hypothetical protein EIP75_21755 [Aquabacterium soli]|uniref:Uncharacterized protein n=2 Tax=Aquabacterium soli TaxID=2493092 RepID=A0A3R8U0M7_9BURK|nr:hypothetical protein EIP75_21755 [Aquabacterium soli]
MSFTNGYRAHLAQLDAEHLGFWLMHYPSGVSMRLQERIKFASKLIAKACAVSRSSAYEAFSKATGFQDWFELNRELNRYNNDDAQAPSSWLERLSGTYFLLVEHQEEVPLAPAHIGELEAFAEKVARLTSAAPEVVLDVVCAGLSGSAAWHEVVGRRLLEASKPLYGFQVDEVSAGGRRRAPGAFSRSPACMALTEMLDEQTLDFAEQSKPQQLDAGRWLDEVLREQPGFLEGGLVKASLLLKTGEYAAARKMVNDYVRLAHRCIPKDFAGRIPWVYLSNRVYLRLLALQCRVHYLWTDVRSSLAIARKVYRLNPEDNQGMRFLLPLLLLEVQDYSAAKLSLRHSKNDTHGLASLNRAFVAFANKERDVFRRELLTALFDLPWAVLFLKSDVSTAPYSDDAFRMVAPDVDWYAEFAWQPYHSVRGLRKACQRILAEPMVQQADAELRSLWLAGSAEPRNAKPNRRDAWFAAKDVWIERTTAPTAWK